MHFHAAGDAGTLKGWYYMVLSPFGLYGSFYFCLPGKQAGCSACSRQAGRHGEGVTAH